ncbi:MAG: preprotein translocase subunit SecY, partial [Deltaproteobacteria bacterium]|nr:preprotein translocase subunit SecY [Deltaproteobacteria bacterium]
MLGGFQNIARVPELKRRILFTALMLVVYRIGIHVPTPGINNVALKAVFESQAGTLFGMIDMFSGGALARFSIFTLGIMPYISASIILQLLTVVIPQLEKLSKEGELGRKKITQYTRYGTVVLSIIQGMGIAVGLESVAAGGAGSVVYNPGWSFRLMTVLTLTSGTAFLMWLGEQITERGIGNGISLIIFAGIVARFPSGLVRSVELVRTGEIAIFWALILLALMVAVVGVIIFFERAHRRIPVQYARRIVGRRVYGGQSTHLPLKVNTAGVIPPIFASSILLFPATIANFIKHPVTQSVSNALTPGSVAYE